MHGHMNVKVTAGVEIYANKDLAFKISTRHVPCLLFVSYFIQQLHSGLL